MFIDPEADGAKLRWGLLFVIVVGAGGVGWKAATTLGAIELNSRQAVQQIAALRTQLEDKNKGQDVAIDRNSGKIDLQDARLQKIQLSVQHLTDALASMDAQIAALARHLNGKAYQ